MKGKDLKGSFPFILIRIVSSGARLDTLIQDLPTCSRISRAQIALQPASLQKIVEPATPSRSWRPVVSR